MIWFLVVLSAVLLFTAPFYSIFIWVTFYCSFFIFELTHSTPGPTFFTGYGIAYYGGGVLWSVYKYSAKFNERRRKEEGAKAAELAETQGENARLMREVRRNSLKRERELKEEQEDELTYGDLADRFVQLVSSTGEFAEGIARASMIIAKEESEQHTANDIVFLDISKIAGVISEANGKVPDRLVELCHAILRRITPDQCGDRKKAKAIVDHFCTQHGGVGLPFLVTLLAPYDSLHGTQWARMAALAYRDLLLRACALCPSSVALQIVADMYVGQLLPYISGGKSESVQAPSALPCAECQQHYMRLGVPPGATHDTIKQIYRDLCNVWHPDRFEHNERLKDKATKEFQEMQQAYEHISSHFAEAGYSSGN